MSHKEISLTCSDVSNETTPRIVKPPHFNDVESEDDDDDDDAEFDEPRPPPDEHSTPCDYQDDVGSAKRGRGGREKNSMTENNVMELDNEPVHDGDGKATNETNDDEEEEEGEISNKEEKEDMFKMGSKLLLEKDDGIILNNDGQKVEDMADGKVDADSVSDLVDRIEGAVVAVSKDESGAFDSLVATLKKLLPLTLFMADELQTLRDNKKDLLLRNRTLMKENESIRREAEQREFTETKSVGTTTFATTDKMTKEKKCLDEQQGNDDKSKRLEEDSMKRELKKLRFQVKELQQVNQSWERYTRKKCARYEAEIRKMTTKLALSEEKSRKLEKRLEEKFRQYDQTLFDVKRSEDRQKVVAAEYKKERDVLQLKYDEMKRQEKKQEDEIKRLNEVIAGKPAAKVYMKPAAFIVTQQARVVDDTHVQAPRRKSERTEKQGATTAAAVTEVGPAANREKSKRKEEKPPKTKPLSPIPRGPPGYVNGGSPMSLTREELKDQVVLFKEQMDVYRSDFNQERRDREKAVGQVDSLKKELDKTKKKLKEIQKQRMEEEHDLYVAARVGAAHMHFLPENTQEMRLREIKEETRGKGRYTAHGRKHIKTNLDVNDAELDRLEGHLYAEIE